MKEINMTKAISCMHVFRKTQLIKVIKPKKLES